MSTTYASRTNNDNKQQTNPEDNTDALAIPEGKARKFQSSFAQMDHAGKTHGSFKRFNQRFLEVKKQQRKTVITDAVVDLSFLQETPKEIKSFPWHLIFFALLSALIGAMAAYQQWIPLPFLLAPVALSASLIALAMKTRIHRFQFLSSNADIPILDINALQPNNATASAFIIDLQQAINTASQLLPRGKQYTPIAIAEMRRLYESGLIDESGYKKIKQSIFSST